MESSSNAAPLTGEIQKINVAERIYQQLKDDIFNFQLLPGDRFSETEIANRMRASRTPVREALYRLERDGYVQVHFRSRWQVRPFDFIYYEELYDVRTVLEKEALKRLCGRADVEALLAEQRRIWCGDDACRDQQSVSVAELDERFHFSLVTLAGNSEMAAVHRDVCERLRIIRRLDFTQQSRVDATYREHNRILQLILRGQVEPATKELVRHIEASKRNVRSITDQRIQQAKLHHRY